jgi:hypothetical protein
MMTRLGTAVFMSWLVACTGSPEPPPPPPPSCTTVTVYADHDGDGVGAGDPSDVCLDDPDQLPPNTAKLSGDCDDNDPTVSQSIIGYADADGDHVTVATSTELCAASLPAGFLPIAHGNDCDDNDPTVSELHTFYVDVDGDGYGDPAHPITVCANVPPLGYALDGSDPDDTNLAITPLDVDGDHVADVNDCAPMNANAWELHTVYVDADHDNYDAGAMSACIGTTAPPGYSLVTYGPDCDDQNATLTLLRPAYVDADHDTWGTGSAVQMCVATLPSGYASRNGDCNDSDASVSLAIAGYADADGDGWGSGSAQPFCVANAAALPWGYAGQVGDCNDQDATVHAQIYGYVDADGDGYGSTTLVGMCAASLPAGYASNNYDFNDADPNITIHQVVASVYQPQYSPNCNGSYCAGVIDLLLTQAVATEVTVSSYSRAIWCIYGKSGTTITSAVAMGYERNTIYPNYVCGLPDLQFACNSTYSYGAVTYSLKRVGTANGCTAEGNPGSYISNYETYSASLIVK